mmetsp:Transcript_69114/g.152577  ORF Transcript_69114/g.152577 Transcript_69114/m.152577 type:complete len:87 (+) Transcript_69114:1245-1505(+)
MNTQLVVTERMTFTLWVSVSLACSQMTNIADTADTPIPADIPAAPGGPMTRIPLTLMQPNLMRVALMKKADIDACKVQMVNFCVIC